MNTNTYCYSRYKTKRNPTRVVPVGNVLVGGDNPIRIQSMTTTPTQDVDATVKQCIALAEAGCEIIRITAQNVAAAKALKDIHKKFRDAKFDNPLVADIHFLPKAAMEAVEHVEKVRINPGNYADKKKFAILEYTDAEYESELQRLHEAFSPFILRAKELGRSIRIGTNHGSLSDRIMNRYGDTPLGMVESALEFIRIAESHGFKDIILSLKASNPKVMIQAYRLVVDKMNREDMHYPLHLGVTEAGDGEDGRIKSAIGIGSLLLDGLGDTIRVSLTEDPVYEIPVARDLADITHKLWETPFSEEEKYPQDAIDPYTYTRRSITPIDLSESIPITHTTHPAVIIKAHQPLKNYEQIAKNVFQANNRSSENKIEGLLLTFNSLEELPHFKKLHTLLKDSIPFFVLELDPSLEPSALDAFSELQNTLFCRTFKNTETDLLETFLNTAKKQKATLAIDCRAEALATLGPVLQKHKDSPFIITASTPQPGIHALGTYRAITEELKKHKLTPPIWIRNTVPNTINLQNFFTSHLLEASILSGNLFCDGIGDIISIETESDMPRALALAYNILQGTRLRLTKTEFVACPSCGRTLFDLETTTQAVREKTGHLKGVTIAIMGCIVNGPGEMADADFGYVGGSPDKINLYVGKECVKYNIPQEEAVDRLIELIKEHGKWVDAPQSQQAVSAT